MTTLGLLLLILSPDSKLSRKVCSSFVINVVIDITYSLQLIVMTFINIQYQSEKLSKCIEGLKCLWNTVKTVVA